MPPFSGEFFFSTVFKFILHFSKLKIKNKLNKNKKVRGGLGQQVVAEPPPIWPKRIAELPLIVYPTSKI
jgi:hypothetical protein